MKLYLPKTLEGFYDETELEPHTTFKFRTEDTVKMTVKLITEELAKRTSIPEKYWSLIGPDQCMYDENDEFIDFAQTLDDDPEYLDINGSLKATGEKDEHDVICCLNKAVYRI